jgi:hypothetical protein
MPRVPDDKLGQLHDPVLAADHRAEFRRDKMA